MPRDVSRVELPLLQKVQLIFPDMLRTELIGGAVEIRSELPHRADVAPCGSLRVITAIEFVEHPCSKLGHMDLLVTHTLSVQADCRIFRERVASAAQAAEVKRRCGKLSGHLDIERAFPYFRTGRRRMSGLGTWRSVGFPTTKSGGPCAL